MARPLLETFVSVSVWKHRQNDSHYSEGVPDLPLETLPNRPILSILEAKNCTEL